MNVFLVVGFVNFERHVEFVEGRYSAQHVVVSELCDSVALGCERTGLRLLSESHAGGRFLRFFSLSAFSLESCALNLLLLSLFSILRCVPQASVHIKSLGYCLLKISQIIEMSLPFLTKSDFRDRSFKYTITRYSKNTPKM